MTPTMRDQVLDALTAAHADGVIAVPRKPGRTRAQALADATDRVLAALATVPQNTPAPASWCCPKRPRS